MNRSTTVYRYIAIIFCLLVLTTGFHSSSVPTGQDVPAELDFNPTKHFVITLINYNSNQVDTQQLQDSLPGITDRYQAYDNTYDIQFANSSYESMVNSYIDTLAVDDWTSDLNVTALNQQVDDFGRKDIFTRQNGTAIPVKPLESYLADNLPTSDLPNKDLSHIFMFNLSRLDNRAHWFNVTEYDLDSGAARNYWRLEWDYPRNYDVKFPYAAYSKSEDIALIDPTAHQWYLNWRQIWNTNVDRHPTYNQTLTDWIAGESDQVKTDRITDTLLEWSTDWITNIFGMYTFPLRFGTTLEVQLATLYNSSVMNQSQLDWIINNHEIIEETNKVLRTSDLRVDVDWYDVNNHSYSADYLAAQKIAYTDKQNQPSPFANWSYYEGTEIWRSILFDNSVQNTYYDASSSDIVVRGIILLLDNASYVGGVNEIPWSGGLYTGLGGQQTVTMLWELGRAFYPDGSKKAGLSKVLIHEIGHSIGFPHTFTNRFTSDFANDVMGYYPGTSDYSELVRLAYDRNAADNQIFQLQQQYERLFNQNASAFEDVLQETQNTFTTIVEHHQSKEFYQAYNLTIEQIDILQQAEQNYEQSSMTTISSSSSSPIPTVSTSSSTKKESTLPTTETGLLGITPWIGSGLLLWAIVRRLKSDRRTEY